MKRHLTLGRKLAISLLLPVLALLGFGGITSYQAYQAMDKAAAMTPMVALSVAGSSLAHELQKERGMSAGFIGSGGRQFASELQAQRRQSDQRLAELKARLGTGAGDTLQALQNLQGLRNLVDGNNAQVGTVVTGYTGMIRQLLTLVDDAVGLAHDGSTAAELAAYSAFLQSKERMGIIRAVLSNTFGADHFGPGLYRRFITLEAEQAAYLERFNRLASPEWQALYQHKAGNNDEVARLQQLAHAHADTGGFNQNATQWFGAATRHINQLKAVEDGLAASLAEHVQQLHQAAATRFWLSLTLSLAVLIVTLALSVWLMHGIRRGVHTLHQGMLRITQDNDFTRDVPVQGNDELAELARSLNTMQHHLNELLQGVSEASQRLFGNADHTQGSVQEVRLHIENGTGQVELVVSATSQMAATVAEIARHASDTYGAANDSILRAEEGDHDVDDTIAAIEEVALALNEGERRVQEVAQHTRDVENCLTTIKQISERTNLLALNAAIEAARAGESGRGFAVVADEVRALAMQTQHTAAEIDDMLARLREGVESAVTAMGTGRNKAGYSVEEARKAGVELTTIVGEIRKVNAMSEQVATATEEQRTVTDDIQHNVILIRDGYQATLDIAGHLQQQGEALSELAAQLQQRLAQFRLRESH
ncbi:methyl-accepting chemotaxis protein [Oceanimonas sp. CHS3-5]|uniref:methyl-accepting chemotaxis protein n=1 Tax=Oceanimonas sp. CHS3-5 TaxID=3068186 RepID=UPI00273E7C09|nr:methyl-accepting chemotaxis protein [Oceanimonas sp. CHS3-5]MDP5293472.1 methyl-accepting chemotaxis protein [Oceanimonas sp. CHS3-5]